MGVSKRGEEGKRVVESFLKEPCRDIGKPSVLPQVLSSLQRPVKSCSLYTCWSGLSGTTVRSMFLRNPEENLALLYRRTSFLKVICGICKGRKGTRIMGKKASHYYFITNATAVVRTLTGTLSS